MFTLHTVFKRKDIGEIAEIRIADAENEFDYEVVGETDIGRAEELCGDIRALEIKRYGTNLQSPCGTCILILYQNGDYDMISCVEPKHVKQKDGKFLSYHSWYQCDPDELEAIVEKYSG